MQAGGVNWVHEDPVTKSKRVTDLLGNIVSSVELDPWGADTNRSSNAAFQPKKFTSYERDANGSDEAKFRRYTRWHSRFDQPDPYDGSYDLTDPQSFNRYAYVGNDPVNFVDPSGLRPNFFCEVSGNAETGFSTYCVVNGWDRWGGFEPKQGGSGGQKKPAPHPHPTPNVNPQQSQFDDCARKAWRQYRKTYLKTSAKAVGGGIGLGIGLGVMRGAPSAAGEGLGSVGFGVRGAFHAFGDTSVPFVGRLLSGMYEAVDGAFIGGTVSFFSGRMAFDSIRQANQNTNSLNAALDECKKKFPNANHSFTFLNF